MSSTPPIAHLLSIHFPYPSQCFQARNSRSLKMQLNGCQTYGAGSVRKYSDPWILLNNIEILLLTQYLFSTVQHIYHEGNIHLASWRCSKHLVDFRNTLKRNHAFVELLHCAKSRPILTAASNKLGGRVKSFSAICIDFCAFNIAIGHLSVVYKCCYFWLLLLYRLRIICFFFVTTSLPRHVNFQGHFLPIGAI